MCRVVLVMVIACGTAERDPLGTLDLAAASTEIVAMVDGCEGLARALDRLGAAGISGRALIGLVDDALAASRGRCDQPPSGDGTAHALARARLHDDRPQAALEALAAPSHEPAIRLRRAELLDRTGDPRAALDELAAAFVADEATFALRRRLVVADHARAARHADAANAIASAPITERPQLAYRAASDAPLETLAALAVAAVEPELATAAGDRLERERGPGAALAARERAAKLAPARAEHHDALARSLVAGDRLEDAVAAWDRAAAIAPAQAAYRLAPIRALAATNLAAARARVDALAQLATDVDMLLVASAAAAVVDDRPRAVRFAREAQRLRPGDGRLAFVVAERLAESGEREAAARAYVELLACGAHGRPWHRHEVAGKLAALATDAASARTVIAALDGRACAPVAAEDLATYIDGVRATARAATGTD